MRECVHEWVWMDGSGVETSHHTYPPLFFSLSLSQRGVFFYQYDFEKITTGLFLTRSSTYDFASKFEVVVDEELPIAVSFEAVSALVVVSEFEISPHSI